MMPMNEIRTEVVICEVCEGHGKTRYRTYSEFDDVEIEAGQPCGNCGGKGRLRKTTTIVYESL